MREIKFRAWDKQKKIMHKNFQFIRSGVDGNDWIIFDSDTEKQKWDGNFNPYFAQQFKLMQFTGLIDKLGKEIYIGDILATSNNDPKYDIWEKEDYEFTVVEANAHQLGINYSNWYIDCDEDCSSVFSAKFVEVIGNVFENPELLETK